MSTPGTAEVRRPSLADMLGPALDYYNSVPVLGPLVFLIILIIFFTIRSPVFFSTHNFSQILQQVMEVATLGVGQTLIILTAGIDLSNGAIMVFASIVMAKLATQGTPVALAVLAGLAVATALSFINGAIVSRVRLPPFIVTLGMLNIVYASTLLYSGGASIINLPSGLLFTGNNISLGAFQVAAGPVVMLAVVAIMWYALTQTAWGRHVYALGNSIESAARTGINTTRLLISVYATAGLVYGITALLVLGRTTVGDPNAGQTDNLDSITAVVIGGTSLFGGRGSVIGTLIGAIIVGVIRNGLTLIGVDALWQTLATGVIVIVAVAVDQLTRRRRQ